MDSSNLVEEVAGLRNATDNLQRALQTYESCGICGKSNPGMSKHLLKLLFGSTKHILEKKFLKEPGKNKHCKTEHFVWQRKKHSVQDGMDYKKKSCSDQFGGHKKLELGMLDTKTYSRMTAYGRSVQLAQNFDEKIHLADYSLLWQQSRASSLSNGQEAAKRGLWTLATQLLDWNDWQGWCQYQKLCKIASQLYCEEGHQHVLPREQHGSRWRRKTVQIWSI